MTAEAAKTQSAWNSVASLLVHMCPMPRENSPPAATTSAPSDRERDTIGSRELGARAPNLEPFPALDTKPSMTADERGYKNPDPIAGLVKQLQSRSKTRETADPTLATAATPPPMPMTATDTAAHKYVASSKSSPGRTTTTDEARLKELDSIELKQALKDVKDAIERDR